MKCKRCNKDLFKLNNYVLNHICDPVIHIQPERSKREDTLQTTDRVVAMASMYKAMPDFNYTVDGKVMRCSEHDGNVVKEVQ